MISSWIPPQGSISDISNSCMQVSRDILWTEMIVGDPEGMGNEPLYVMAVVEEDTSHPLMERLNIEVALGSPL